jgi:Universal stress protein family
MTLRRASVNGFEPSPGQIVVGVDGSPSSQQALRWAARQARLTGGGLHAVSVWDFPTGVGGLSFWKTSTGSATLARPSTTRLRPVCTPKRPTGCSGPSYAATRRACCWTPPPTPTFWSSEAGDAAEWPGCCSAQLASMSSPTPAARSSSSALSRAPLCDVAIDVTQDDHFPPWSCPRPRWCGDALRVLEIETHFPTTASVWARRPCRPASRLV